MSFALTKFAARALEIGTVSYKKGIQQVVIEATGLVSDVDLDLGDASGTFWTAAIAAAPAMAAKALETLQNIAAQSSVGCVDIQSPQLLDRVQVAALASNGQYKVDTGVIAPDISFFAGNGETSYYIILTYELNNGIAPVTENLAQTTL